MFSVMINCMCSTSRLIGFRGGSLVFIFVGRALVFIFVVGCWGFPIYLSCWFGVVLGKII